MSGRGVALLKDVPLLTAALFLIAPPVLAGEHVHAGDQPAFRSQPTAARIARAAPLAVETISVVLTTARQPAPMYVDIVGPDGQTRRFPVEGGRAAIQYRQVRLRPGEMLTIRWKPAK